VFGRDTIINMPGMLHVVDGEWKALSTSLESLSDASSSVVPSIDAKQVLSRAVPGTVSAQAAQGSFDRYLEHHRRLSQALREYSYTATDTGRLFDDADESCANKATSITSRFHYAPEPEPASSSSAISASTVFSADLLRRLDGN